jgi:hypothetical protein
MWRNIYVLISWLFPPNSIWNNALINVSISCWYIYLHYLCACHKPATGLQNYWLSVFKHYLLWVRQNMPMNCSSNYLLAGVCYCYLWENKIRWNKVYRTIESSWKDSLQVYRNPRNIIKLYSALVLSEQSNCIDRQNLLYTVTDQDVVFLVPDSCWRTIRNGKIISADTIENV